MCKLFSNFYPTTTTKDIIAIKLRAITEYISAGYLQKEQKLSLSHNKTIRHDTRNSQALQELTTPPYSQTDKQADCDQ